MFHASFQPLRTREPEEDEDDDDDYEPGDWDGAEDYVLTERLQCSIVRSVPCQVRQVPIASRVGLELLRNAKVAGSASVLLATALAASLLVAAPVQHRDAGLRPTRARTQDSMVKEDMTTQTKGEGEVQTSGAVAVQSQSTVRVSKGGATVVQQGAVHTHGCHCCCVDCGCEHGAVAYCSSLTCPMGYVPKDGSENIPCKGDNCTLQVDLLVCCDRISSCQGYVCQPTWSLRDNATRVLCSSGYCSLEDNAVCCEQKATCTDYGCPAGSAVVSEPENFMCSGSTCTFDDCCVQIPGISISTTRGSEIWIPTSKSYEIDSSTAEMSMTCDLNCFNEGVDSVMVELPASEVTDLGKCRESCVQNEECHGIVYRKDFEQTGHGPCHGKKNIHISLCQVGGDFVTELIKDRPWGHCALLGDPHVVQWDRPSHLNLPTYDNYDAGDYNLVDSEELRIQTRFGFTQQFPTATSTKGVAVSGSKIGGKVLVAGYSEKQKKFIVWWDGQVVLPNKGDYLDDGVLVAKFDDMDPATFHSEARHTIGEATEKVPSWTFEFKDASLHIYVLLGPDNVNVVVHMKKLSYPMDGLCGNFNCDPNDEDAQALEVRQQAHALEWQASLFGQAGGTFHEKVYVHGTVDGDVLATCDPELLEKGKKACGFDNGVDSTEANACLLDVCTAKTVDVAKIDVETMGVENEAEEEEQEEDTATI